MGKRTIACYGTLLLVIVSVNCCYLAKQGYFVAKYSFQAKPIDRLLRGGKLSATERDLLTTVSRIHSFAVDSLGLAGRKNFTRYVSIDKKYLVDVVAAAKADTFKEYQWRYPFFGNFPYKGFFKRRDAVDEGARLRRKGLDVTIGAVDAFSTLGFFSDPVYSFMEHFSLYQLAALIIHEQTHATIFLKNQVNFNEEAATFVGDEGALLFIRKEYGDTSVAYREALLEKGDHEEWVRKLQALYRALDTVYAERLSLREKLEKKREIIAGFKKSVMDNYSTLFKTTLYQGVEKADINNAYVLVRMNYYQDLSFMYDIYNQSNSDLASVVRQLRALSRIKHGNPKEYLRKKMPGNG